MASEAATCQVAVIDEARLFAEALAEFLGSAPGVTAAAVDPKAPPSERLGPTDVVLLGWSTRPGPSGTHLIDAVRRNFPSTPVVLIVDEPGAEALHAVCELAAAGWLSRDTPLPTLVRAVHDARQGTPVRSDRASRPIRDLLGPGIGDLTARELDVLAVVAEGLDNQAVGERLGISPHTVRSHVQNVLAKLGVPSRKRAVAMVRQAGLLSTNGSQNV